MAAIMMIPDVGGIIVVTGSRIAIPAEGPIPGSTPIIVPMRHPTNAQKRFVAEKAVAKPCIRKSKENPIAARYFSRNPMGKGSSRSFMNRK